MQSPRVPSPPRSPSVGRTGGKVTCGQSRTVINCGPACEVEDAGLNRVVYSRVLALGMPSRSSDLRGEGGVPVLLRSPAMQEYHESGPQDECTSPVLFAARPAAGPPGRRGDAAGSSDSTRGKKTRSTPAGSRTDEAMRRAEAFRREDLAAPGEYVIEPQRSGGAFDPLGLRAGHVARADDVAALGDVLRGRWLFITLTVDRSKFLSPAMAYQRCNPRVCRVAAALREAAVWVAAFEVQTKTGDGWPHWHMMIHVGEDGRSLAELKAVVERAWCVVSEHEGEVDRSTGEVLTWKAREQIGFVDVQDGRSAGGLARPRARVGATGLGTTG